MSSERLQCVPVARSALRDLREANGRDEETGDGPGNFTWIALSMGMVVLDSLTRSDEPVGERWKTLLTGHAIEAEDATIIYQLRCSLLHGYGLPKPSSIFERVVAMTREQDAYAVDTTTAGYAWSASQCSAHAWLNGSRSRHQTDGTPA